MIKVEKYWRKRSFVTDDGRSFGNIEEAQAHEQRREAALKRSEEEFSILTEAQKRVVGEWFDKFFSDDDYYADSTPIEKWATLKWLLKLHSWTPTGPKEIKFAFVYDAHDDSEHSGLAWRWIMFNGMSEFPALVENILPNGHVQNEDRSWTLQVLDAQEMQWVTVNARWHVAIQVEGEEHE